MDALHRRVKHIEEEDVRADNKRLKMMLDCSENRTRDAWRENDRATWHYHHLRRWSIMVENLLLPRLRYQEPPYALPETLLAPVTHNDPRDPYVAARDAATAPTKLDLDLVTSYHWLIMAPKAMSDSSLRGSMLLWRQSEQGWAVELCRWFEKTEMVFGISECAEERKVKFAAATLQGHALMWWNSLVATRGLEAANRIT
ncbi:hypothetical protein Tco_1288820 [Tanacetum coccineum]